MEAFKDWLEKRYSCTQSIFKPWCICCETFLTNGKSELENHVASEKHQKNMMLLPSVLRERTSMADHLDSCNVTKEDVAIYEMVMVCKVAEGNSSIVTVERDIAANRRLHPKDPVLKRVQLGRSKATAIIKDGWLNQFNSSL